MPIPLVIRRIAERLSRSVVLRRRLPAEFGALPVYVSPGASLIYWRGLRLPAFDDLYDFARHYLRPGQVVWDIGGNVGVFSFAAAARVGPTGRVLTFEPDLWSVRLLRRSADLNRDRAAPVHILPVAVSESLSLEWLHIPERSRAASHLATTGDGAGAAITGAIRERHLVPVINLDWVAAQQPPPDILKIDVDGAELGVLRGASHLLRTRRPVILTEVYERNADAVTALLRSHGYTLCSYEHGEARKRPVDRATYNTLALPPSA